MRTPTVCTDDKITFAIIGAKQLIMDQETILRISGLNKWYELNRGRLQILKDISFEVPRGQVLAIVGPSGSGKTTLLGLCAGLDHASAGRIELAGTDLTTLTEDQRAQLRNLHIGFIFQDFQLLPTLTAAENVAVPMELQGTRGALAEAGQLLDRVGLSGRLRHYPSQLSGGEQQRVAIARAFSTKPALLFADEPTGNLDHETGMQIQELLFELNQSLGTTLILVTHDADLASKADRIIRLRGGEIVEDHDNTLQ